MRTLFFLLLALGVGFVWWSSGVLPSTVAAHFAVDGAADGFMPRGQYVAFMMGLVIAVPTHVFWTARLASRLPLRFINLPNKQYWLAPERRAATLASLGAFGVWVACGLLGVLCVAHWLVVRANLEHPPRLEQAPLIAIVAAFLLALFVGIAVVLRRFLRVRVP
jgi:hypothetical protein